MKLVFASSLSHDVLKRHIFLGTLCDPWELIEMRFNVLGSGSFGSADWHRVTLDRMVAMHDILIQYPGEVIVFSDVDIQWFRPAQAAILAAMQDRDVVFQRESPGKEMANCGFLGIRSNSRTTAYFDVLRQATREGRHDQPTTNELIAQKMMPCSYGFFPNAFHNDNYYGRSQCRLEEMIMYHSIGVFPNIGKSSVQFKLERHLAMRARILGQCPSLRPIPGSPEIDIRKLPRRYWRNSPLNNPHAP